MAATTLRLRTTGMHCQSCSMLVQMNVEELPGVETVSSDFRTGITEVTFDSDQLQPADIIDTIVAAGYGAETEE
ncbi:MAG: heavy-metal-associated domain-containing protein [Coriobacteriia bacterium]|nr:heavy-metal-associated domain-containing protein [Coriobacteriia bacterium]